MGNLNEFFQRWKAKAAQRRDQGEYVDVKPAPPVSAPAKKTPAMQGWWLHRLRPGARREEQLAALQTGYQELLDLIRTIRDHLERQDSGQHQQAEVLSLIRKNMESGLNRDQQLMDSISRFNRALTSLDESNRNAAQTVSGLVEHSRSSQEMLRAILDRSEKRMMTVTLVLGVVALLAVAGFIYVGMRWSAEMPALSTSPTGGPIVLETLPKLPPGAGESEVPSRVEKPGREQPGMAASSVQEPAGDLSTEPILTPPSPESPAP